MRYLLEIRGVCPILLLTYDVFVPLFVVFYLLRLGYRSHFYVYFRSVLFLQLNGFGHVLGEVLEIERVHADFFQVQRLLFLKKGLN